MSLLERLDDSGCWERFYTYKGSLISGASEVKELRAFIDSGAYRGVYERIVRGEEFPLAKRSVISKLGSDKKRVVYTYPKEENYCLKLLTYLMLRKYDTSFYPCLYSFRPSRTAKDGIRALRSIDGINEMFCYKADISDYFNSVSIERIIPVLEETIGEDRELFEFLSALLSEQRVISGGKVIYEKKGIMAGTPVSAFYANLYLKDMDEYFYERGIPYARYSDDVIVFAKSREEISRRAEEIKGFLYDKGLKLNIRKESMSEPLEGWSFLGFYYKNGAVDIAPATVLKLKQKMRRKARALRRWSERSGAGGQRAAAAFIRIYNKKLLESPEGSELSWSRWFFPVISMDRGLKEIDAYAQDCIRYIISAKRTKARFRVRYDELKRLGYKSLVHEYYAFRKNAKKAENEDS